MPIRTKKEIGENIRSMRKRNHMTLQELADRVTELTGELCTVSRISKWEHGINEPSLRDAGILADALNCSVFAFLGTGNTSENGDAWLTAEERQIMLFGVSKWTGNIHAAINALNLYMTLPPDRRSDVINVMLSEYEHAQEDDTLMPTDVPVNKKYIMHHWLKL